MNLILQFTSTFNFLVKRQGLESLIFILNTNFLDSPSFINDKIVHIDTNSYKYVMLET